MEAIWNNERSVRESVATAIRASHSGQVSVGVRYPGVPSVDDILGKLTGVDADAATTSERDWERICAAVEPDDPSDIEELVCCDCADNGRVADASRYCSRCGRGLCERCAGRDAVGAAMHAGRGWPVGVCSRCTK